MHFVPFVSSPVFSFNVSVRLLFTAACRWSIHRVLEVCADLQLPRLIVRLRPSLMMMYVHLDSRYFVTFPPRTFLMHSSPCAFELAQTDRITSSRKRMCFRRDAVGVPRENLQGSTSVPFSDFQVCVCVCVCVCMCAEIIIIIIS